MKHSLEENPLNFAGTILRLELMDIGTLT